MKKKVSFFVVALVCLGSTLVYGKKASKITFPEIDQDGKIAIVAHRGYWNCEQGGFSENSIASLTAAQNYGFWGSECDIHLTADGRVIVNHNPDIKGMKIAEHTFAELSAHKLPNGECRPSFEAYANQASTCRTTVLVVEIKSQPTPQAEKMLVDETVRILKEYNMFTPDRVLFISFSEYVCQYIAEKYPLFINQFLTSGKKKDENPAQYADKRINGIDYHYRIFDAHPEWVALAKSRGMSVNVWTVNEEKKIKQMIDLGVDAITTNEPLLVRKMLSNREFRKPHEVRYFSHRGGRKEYDENTLSAFEASYAAGYRGYETDVRMTKDGELVILHDTNLKRTTDMEGRVEEMTADEIRKANTKGGHKVMFLDELIEWLNKKGDVTYVEFELKTRPLDLYPTERLHEYCDKLYKKVTENTPKGAEYIFTSGDYRGLLYIKGKYPDAKMLMITGMPCCDESIELCLSLGMKRIGATMDGTTREAVKKAHKKGLIVSLWPGNSPEDAVFGAYLGADYLCTDVPVAVKNFLSSKAPWINAVY